MKSIHILTVLMCCFVWGANIPLTHWALRELPPMFAAGIRFFGLALILCPFLFPIPRNLTNVFIVAMSIGGLNFLFLYSGLKSTPSSLVAMVGQLSLPLTIFFSMIFLKERMSLQQWLGVSLAFFGVFLIIYEPHYAKFHMGVIYVLLSTILAAVGNISMKRLPPLTGLQLQAWVGLFSVFPLLIGSFWSESISWQLIEKVELSTWGIIAFSIVFVSILGHATFFRMVQKYDVSRVIPYTITVPMWSITISHLIFGENINQHFILGACISLLGLFIISIPNNRLFRIA